LQPLPVGSTAVCLPWPSAGPKLRFLPWLASGCAGSGPRRSSLQVDEPKGSLAARLRRSQAIHAVVAARWRTASRTSPTCLAPPCEWPHGHEVGCPKRTEDAVGLHPSGVFTRRRPRPASCVWTSSLRRPAPQAQGLGRVFGGMLQHFRGEARLQGFAPLESPLPPGGGLDHLGPDALLGFQPLQGLPFPRLGPMHPSVLLSQASRGFVGSRGSHVASGPGQGPSPGCLSESQ
jgi:hypothetical protein